MCGCNKAKGGAVSSVPAAQQAVAANPSDVVRARVACSFPGRQLFVGASGTDYGWARTGQVLVVNRVDLEHGVMKQCLVPSSN